MQAEKDELPVLKMTIEEALAFADEWSRGVTVYPGSQGWRVVCMMLAAEVRDATARIAELQREVEGLRKDAERWRQARKLARYYPSPDGGDYLAFDSLPWPRSCHATTPEYADAAIDRSLSGGEGGGN